MSIADAAGSVGWSYTSVKRWLAIGADLDRQRRTLDHAAALYLDAVAAFDAANADRLARGRKPLPASKRPPAPPSWAPTDDERLFLEFWESTRKAKRAGKVALVSRIAKHGEKRWQPLAFLLRSRFPHEFGNRRAVDAPPASPVDLGRCIVRPETPEEATARHASQQAGEDDETAL